MTFRHDSKIESLYLAVWRPAIPLFPGLGLAPKEPMVEQSLERFLNIRGYHSQNWTDHGDPVSEFA